MTMLSSEDVREIGETVKLQLSNVRNVESELRVALLNSPQVRLRWNENEFYSLIVESESISPPLSTIPNWVNVSDNNEALELEFPYSRLAELEYLLRKTIENHLLEEASDAREVLFSALNEAFKVWSAAGEPMSKEEQIGLIGELNAITSLLQHFTIDQLIEGWDETSRRQIDIVFDETQVECKTVGLDGIHVESSSINQFVSENYPIILAITEVLTDNDSLILPDIVLNLLGEIGTQTTVHHSLALRNKVTSRYPLLLNHREYYHSRWQIGTFSCKIVNDDSIPAVFPLSVPSEIILGKFKFDFTSLEDLDF
jgi:hypothetical protein